ncbi:MAG TPA: glycosyltransferase [Candidatus Nanoarchaeia archaeon]|nr:glycosyltransferase [Candidatus Nanoarchaeia archaeon]
MKKIDKKIVFAAWSCHDQFYALNQWIDSFEKVIKTVISFDPKEQIYLHGKEKMNNNFIELIRLEKPDYIFFWLIYDEFNLSLFDKIKEISPKTKLIGFFGDDDVTFENLSRYYALFFDYCLIFQKNFESIYKKEGISNVYSILGANTSKYHPLNVRKEYDVGFIGTPKSNRYKCIKYLKDNGIKVKVAGAGWEKYPEFKEDYLGKLTTEESTEFISKSKINLSFTRNYFGELHYNSRIFEIMACKSFVITEYFKGYRDLFKENECVLFDTNEYLLKKINYYLKHEKEREEIAKNAYKKTVYQFSYENQLRNIFEKIEKNKEEKISKIETETGKIGYLTTAELKENSSYLSNKLKDNDYVSFKDDSVVKSDYRDFLQIHSLIKSKKDISCCDYYIYNKMIGNYLCFASFSAYEESEKEFHKCIVPYQLVFKKDFFLKNVEEIKKYLLKNEDNLISKENTVLVSIPLIKMKESKYPPVINIGKQYLPKFENDLVYIFHNRKLFLPIYLALLLFFSGKYRKLIASEIINRMHSYMQKRGKNV